MGAARRRGARSRPRAGHRARRRARGGAALRAARDHASAWRPVGDVPTRRRRRARAAARSPTTPGAASAAMAAAVAGWRAGGVAATAKHFPGLGGATVNTDDGPATIERSRAELEATDLPPFAAAIDAGVPLVMVGHARYPALDPDRIASQSPADRRARCCATSSASAASWSPTRWRRRRRWPPAPITAISERAVRAGADLLLLTGQGSYAPVYEHLLALARRSPAFRARVRESAARVLALKGAARERRGDAPAILRAVTAHAERRSDLQRRGRAVRRPVDRAGGDGAADLRARDRARRRAAAADRPDARRPRGPGRAARRCSTAC